MAIKFDCPKCGSQLTARDEHEGREAVCTACNAKVRVPDPLGGLAEFTASRARRRNLFDDVTWGFRRFFLMLCGGVAIIGLAFIALALFARVASEAEIDAWHGSVIVLLVLQCLLLGLICKKLYS